MNEGAGNWIELRGRDGRLHLRLDPARLVIESRRHGVTVLFDLRPYIGTGNSISGTDSAASSTSSSRMPNARDSSSNDSK